VFEKIKEFKLRNFENGHSGADLSKVFTKKSNEQGCSSVLTNSK